MKRSVQLLLALFAALALAACSTTEPADDTTDSTVQTDDGSSSDAETAALARQRAAEQAERERIAALLANTTIYFNYDSDAIRSSDMELIEVHAKHIQATGKKIILEGHADERGTPEYNLALGERRAESVAQLIRTYGVSGSQVEVVTFGEESPANPGHTEQSWQENRRVEIKYQ